jgi:hypothetical protein
MKNSQKQRKSYCSAQYNQKNIFFHPIAPFKLYFLKDKNIPDKACFSGKKG